MLIWTAVAFQIRGVGTLGLRPSNRHLSARGECSGAGDLLSPGCLPEALLARGWLGAV